MERALTEEIKGFNLRRFTDERDGVQDERRQSVHDYSKGEKPTAPYEPSSDPNEICVDLNCYDSCDEDDDAFTAQNVNIIDILNWIPFIYYMNIMLTQRFYINTAITKMFF